MKNSNRSLLILIVLIIAAAAYQVRTRPSQEQEVVVYKELAVEYGPMYQTITESGKVALETRTLDFTLDINSDEDEDDEDGRSLKIAEVYVKQGQRLKAGDPVIRLTDKSINAVRRSLRADKADAELKLEDLKNELDLQSLMAANKREESLLKGSYAETQLALDVNMPQLELKALQDSISVLEQDIRQIEFDLEEGWEDYDDLRKEYEKLKTRYETWDPENLYKYIPLRDSYFQTRDRYEDERKKREDLREDIEDKQREIEKKQEEIAHLQNKLPRSQQSAQQTYETSVLGGQMADEVYSHSLQALETAITDAQKDLADRSDLLADFDAFVGKDGLVLAAEDGLITQVPYQDGDSLRENSSIISYVKENEYELSIDILEEDIPYIKLGSTVDISFNAYPDQAYTGTVEAISTTETSQETVTVSYPVTISLQGDMSRIYGGMTGAVTFITQEVTKTLHLPRKAITRSGDKTYVWIKDADGSMQQKEVVTGFSNGMDVEIISGLEADDLVYIESRVKE